MLRDSSDSMASGENVNEHKESWCVWNSGSKRKPAGCEGEAVREGWKGQVVFGPASHVRDVVLYSKNKGKALVGFMHD